MNDLNTAAAVLAAVVVVGIFEGYRLFHLLLLTPSSAAIVDGLWLLTLLLILGISSLFGLNSAGMLLLLWAGAAGVALALYDSTLLFREEKLVQPRARRFHFALEHLADSSAGPVTMAMTWLVAGPSGAASLRLAQTIVFLPKTFGAVSMHGAHRRALNRRPVARYMMLSTRLIVSSMGLLFLPRAYGIVASVLLVPGDVRLLALAATCLLLVQLAIVPVSVQLRSKGYVNKLSALRVSGTAIGAMAFLAAFRLWGSLEVAVAALAIAVSVPMATAGKMLARSGGGVSS